MEVGSITLLRLRSIADIIMFMTKNAVESSSPSKPFILKVTRIKTTKIMKPLRFARGSKNSIVIKCASKNLSE